MACNCGKKRLMNAQTSANLTASDSQGSIAPDRPDIAAAKAEAAARVDAARAELNNN